MKHILTALITLTCIVGFAQTDEPFYEQKAFDLYKTDILRAFPVKKRIIMYKDEGDFHPEIYWLYTPDCLSNIVWKSNDQFVPMEAYIKEQRRYDSRLRELDVSHLNKRQFKLKEFKKGGYPKLFISPPHLEQGNEERVFVNIYEKHSERETIIYHIEFNRMGEMVDWCRSISITTIVY
ncbi:MAG: hypothetical protein AAF696_16635 [Bacteroidota bacterium]